MANDQKAATAGEMTLPVEVAGRTAIHIFGILPRLSSEILMGVDLQAKLHIGIFSPPRRAVRAWKSDCPTTGLAGKTPEENQRLQEFLRGELKEFEGLTGPTDQVQHFIRLKDDEPIKQRYPPRNLVMQAIINAEVDKLLAQGIIEPSFSPWSSLIVVVKKKDG